MTRETADIICRALLAIVAALRKAYGLPQYNNIVIEIRDSEIIPERNT
jgi:hypothetical protein